MRECLFCSGKEKLTLEDLWPQWLIKSTVGDRSPKIERTIGTDAPVMHDGKFVKARCVCEQCNGGWMSLLETRSKPILEPMIHDSPCVLDYSKQSTVSLWTIRTSMVFEYLRRKEAFYSRADRWHLRKRGLPPPDTLIWIGRYEDGYLPSIEKHGLGGPKLDALGDASVTTFAIGRLAIQSFTTLRSALGEGKGSVGIGRGLGISGLFRFGPRWTAMFGGRHPKALPTRSLHS